MTGARTDPKSPFDHRALLYTSDREFLDGIVPFVREGLDAGEPVFAAFVPERLELLRAELGPLADAVHFEDMSEVGANPGRLLSAWMRFLDGAESGTGRMRGVGEPVFKGRTADEIDECRRHEELLNVAMAERFGVTALCPYDASALPADVIADARATHPVVAAPGECAECADFEPHADPLRGTLPEPPVPARHLFVSSRNLRDIRREATDVALEAGLSADRTFDFVMAVGEAVTNTLLHANGEGTVRIWHDDGRLVCDVIDRGRLRDPLAGRLPPRPRQVHGRGLWLVNQLCDLVQIRSSPVRTIVRMHMRA